MDSVPRALDRSSLAVLLILTVQCSAASQEEANRAPQKYTVIPPRTLNGLPGVKWMSGGGSSRVP